MYPYMEEVTFAFYYVLAFFKENLVDGAPRRGPSAPLLPLEVKRTGLVRAARVSRDPGL